MFYESRSSELERKMGGKFHLLFRISAIWYQTLENICPWRIIYVEVMRECHSPSSWTWKRMFFRGLLIQRVQRDLFISPFTQTQSCQKRIHQARLIRRQNS